MKPENASTLGGRLTLGTGERGRELLEHDRILGFYTDFSGNFKSDPTCTELVLLLGDSVLLHLKPHLIRCVARLPDPPCQDKTGPFHQRVDLACALVLSNPAGSAAVPRGNQAAAEPAH